MRPKPEWEVIAGESATVQGLFTGYAGVLALLPLIGSVLGALGGSLFWHGALGMMGGLIVGVVGAVIGYVLTLVMTYVSSLIINALAPSFDGTQNVIQATKVAVYGNTALWVAGLFGFIPVLGALIALAGFGYSCYLTYLGVARLMNPPADKAIGYAAVAIIINIVLFAVVFWVLAIITGIITAMTIGAAAVTGAAMLGH